MSELPKIPTIADLPTGTELTEDQARQMLQREIWVSGGQRYFAKKIGTSIAFISLAARGKKRLSNKLLDYLGLERIEVYRKK